jgi:hypothetical protein
MSLNASLEDPIVIGDDYDFDRSIEDIPEGAAVVAGWLTIKEDIADPDSAAVIHKLVTSTPQTGIGEIVDDGNNSTRTARIIVQLTNADTALFNPRILYWYDIQIRTDTEKNYTVERGRFLPVQQVTDAQQQ